MKTKIAAIIISVIAGLGVVPVSVHAIVVCTNTVHNTNDSGPGSLRAALAAASDGETITFCPSVTGTILLTTGELLVSNSVTILGPGANVLAVDGNAASRVFYITNGVTATISGLTISNGQAGSFNSGGGIYNDHSTLTVSNCTVAGNSADGGGGIYNSGAGSSATLAIVQSTLSGNSATGNGGGIYNDAFSFGSATLAITNSTLSGNSALNGGGIYNDGVLAVATVTIINSTLNGNAASNSNGGGGIHNTGASGTATVNIGSTILSNSAPVATNIKNDSGTVNSLGYNLSSDLTGPFTGTGDLVNPNPRLGPLQDNGGPTFTHALLPGSLAIDAGEPTSTLTTDQRGFPRPVNSRIDIGAVEFGSCGSASITVQNANDTGVGTLRKALTDICDGGTIDFAPNVTNTITLLTGELLVTRSVTILGPGAKVLAVNGNAAGRVFHITASNTVTIAGLTITNGVATGFFPTGAGAGIYNSQSMLTVSNCTVSGNAADSNNGGDGGGIYNDGAFGSAALAIVNSTLSGNSGRFGGGIVNDGSTGSATLAIVNSTLSGNSVPGASGGGIYNSGFNGIAPVVIVNSTLSGNSADALGGGIYNDGFAGNVTVEIGSTILNNNASTGANIYNRSGTVTSLGYNLSSDPGVYNDSGGTGDLNATGDQISTDPLLGPLQDNGGPTLTHALLCGSPALDKGTNFTGAATDQRGFPRPFDNLGIPNAADGTDIGAFELQNTAPVALCTNVTVAADSNCVANASIDNSSSDPDGDPVTLTQSPAGPYPLGMNSVTLTVTDCYGASNSCPAIVNVVDTTPPVPVVASLPAVLGQCSASVTAPSALDNCAGLLAATTSDPTTYTNQGSFTVHWIYNDGNGNSATQQQSVVVHDTTPPSIACPGNIIASSGPGQCSAVVNWGTLTASDNCSTATVTCVPASGSFFSQGVTPVVCTATDAVGNTNSCSFTVTVNQPATCGITVGGDSLGPVLCPGRTAVLTAPNGKKRYLWHGPEKDGATVQTIVVGTAGLYTCTQENWYDGTNCCSVVITVLPPPPCGIIAPHGLTICRGQTTTLVGPVGMKSQYWLGPQNNGLNTRSNTVSLAGTYTLHVVNSNGCENACSVTVTTLTCP